MINIKTTATITAPELKKLIAEYMEIRSNLKVASVSFAVSPRYNQRDGIDGYELKSVDVVFDPKPAQIEQALKYPPGMRSTEPEYPQ